MKKTIVLASLTLALVLAAAAQDGGRTLKPNYKRIAKLAAKADSRFFADTLDARFLRCDPQLGIDDYRCYYFGEAGQSLHEVWHRLQLLSSRFGYNSRQAGDAAWQYSMLHSAVWSTGNGTRKKPLYVRSAEDAQLIVDEAGTPLWFKLRKGKAFSVAPQQ